MLLIFLFFMLFFVVMFWKYLSVYFLGIMSLFSFLMLFGVNFFWKSSLYENFLFLCGDKSFSFILILFFWFFSNLVNLDGYDLFFIMFSIVFVLKWFWNFGFWMFSFVYGKFRWVFLFRSFMVVLLYVMVVFIFDLNVLSYICWWFV